jgi:hypothetical protein
LPERSPENQEIVKLLGKLKEETPEYPADLLEARKYSFMKQMIDLKISGEDRPAETKGPAKGGRAGASGAALGGGATVLGLPLKTALAIGAVIVLLTAGYLFRDRIVEFLAENGLITTQETVPPPSASTPAGPAGETPAAITAPTFGAPSGGQATEAAPGPQGTPTSPPQSGPLSVFEYLMCVLRNGAESCR